MQLLLNNIIIQTDSFLRTYLQSLGLEQISSGLLTAFLAGALIMQSFFAFYTVTLKQLYFLMASAFVLAPTALMVLVFVSGSAVFGYALWFVFVVVGMCLGPSFGWCYDLWNRITYSSEDGAALISLFSYLTSWLSFVMFQIYDLTGDKNLLLYFNSAEFCMALLLLAAVKLARNS
uniref:Uncharacterized protein n=1 Tax=Heterosigma akashiwo TaxID=2829 RepID=A0A7S3XKJ9_HETAK